MRKAEVFFHGEKAGMPEDIPDILAEASKLVRKEKKSMSSESSEILSRQVISMNTPGSILRDFEILLNFIGTDRPGVTEKEKLLPLKALPKINADLTCPLRFDLKRPGHRSYPNINALYLLVRASGISYVERTGTGHRRIVPDDEACMSWIGLNLTERYFTLLETWMFKAKPEILKQGRMRDTPLKQWSDFFGHIPSRGLNFGDNREYDGICSRTPTLYTIALMEMFGLIYVRHRDPEKGKGWRPERVNRTLFGDALLELFKTAFNDLKYWIIDDDLKMWITEEQLNRLRTEEAEMVHDSFGKLYPPLFPFFPDLQRNLEIPKHEFHDGVYIFKVSFGKDIRRHIAIPAKMTLNRLSDKILEAYEFAHDNHLHRFTCINRHGSDVHINDPELRQGTLLTSEFLIGDLPLRPGELMIYLFDFGDRWKFEVELEKIDPDAPEMKEPAVIKSNGETPVQYGYY